MLVINLDVFCIFCLLLECRDNVLFGSYVDEGFIAPQAFATLVCQDFDDMNLSKPGKWLLS